MGCMLSAASCNKWWMDTIIGTKDYEKEQKVIEKLGENHVFFLPYLMGERSPHNDPQARGTFIGMSMDTTRADMTQAVLEGVMMRNGDAYALALRRPDGEIVARRMPWFSLTRHPWLKKPFVRGFPVLIETLVNGIKALNRSAEHQAEGTEEELKGWHLVLTLLLSLAMAVGLFVVVPHLLSLLMQWLELGGGVEGLTFHLWDGLFKCLIFMGYIWAISFVPDIRRVFQYHGAEHKVIHAFEAGGDVDAATAARMSRLHPRCGTTFLLFVISISIILHAVLVPLLLFIYCPEGAVAKQALTIVFKLLLMVPISALAYELIRYAARMPDGFMATLLRAPGLTLQRMTTAEPDERQLDVAVVALREALGAQAGDNIITAPYRRDA